METPRKAQTNTVPIEGMSHTMRGHKRDKQVQMTWITRLELHCDAVTSGVPILLRLVTPTPGEGTQDT